ncbi:site-specific integrase [Microcoleus sp. BROC3]|uniref:site-specific integrase n=1 Tax=Microcoleus sp. BROC3 TaxID=3055323 RepID=UPI002FD35395
MVELLRRELGLARYSSISATWADQWIYRMKIEDNLAPGTIRKYVGSLARALDWHIRRHSDRTYQVPVNALRLLPRSYSQYTANEADQLLLRGKKPKVDQLRDRRLSAEEEDSIRKALDGIKRDDRERALPIDPAFHLLFDLILNTGMRLSEAYRLRVDHIDMEAYIIHLDSSKVEDYITKRRSVPIPPCLRARLREWCKGRNGLIFPFWDGKRPSMIRTSNNLSSRFKTLFHYAGLEDFKEHDLRHEATCRWVSMRDKNNGWLWSETEICKIMGWSSSNMFLRYASLRASDLSKRMDW